MTTSISVSHIGNEKRGFHLGTIIPNRLHLILKFDLTLLIASHSIQTTLL